MSVSAHRFLLLLAQLAFFGGTFVHASDLNHKGDTRQSGFHTMSPALQAMQQDDSQNPAMLWVKDGEALWQQVDGAKKKSCASCHAEPGKFLRGVAIRYPQFDARSLYPMNLAGRINQCRQRHMGATRFTSESAELLSLQSFVALQSRGIGIRPSKDVRMKATIAKGATHFSTRMGQLDLSCADCHEHLAGKRLGGTVIPQGHPTGYPIYRLEWQGVGSVQRRIRNCMSGIRAEPYAWDSIEMIELESYLTARAAGMRLDAPGVRP